MKKKKNKVIIIVGIVLVYILFIGGAIVTNDSRIIGMLLFGFALVIGGALGYYTGSIVFFPSTTKSGRIIKSNNYYGNRDDLVWWLGNIANGFIIFLGIMIILGAFE